MTDALEFIKHYIVADRGRGMQLSVSHGQEGRKVMASTVGRMTREELKQLIGAVVEEKLTEIIGDPDEGLTVRESLRQRLVRQKESVARGQRGEALDDVVQRLGLE
jgi:hypothetical protein